MITSAHAEALRKYAALDVSPDDAVEAEALAQLFTKDEAAGQVDEVSLKYTVVNAETAQEKLAADRRLERIPFGSPRLDRTEQAAPRRCSLLDRPVPASGKDITRDQIPDQLGQLLLFGKQTDREARLELLTSPRIFPSGRKFCRSVRRRTGAVASETTVGQISAVETP